MSEGRGTAVRAFYKAWNRRDFDSALRLADQDLEIRPMSALGDLRIRGHDEAKRFWAQFFDGFDELTVEPIEDPLIAEERVIVTLRWWGRGRGGIEVDQTVVDVWTFHDGLAVRLEGFETKAEALKAIGLSD